MLGTLKFFWELGMLLIVVFVAPVVGLLWPIGMLAWAGVSAIISPFSKSHPAKSYPPM